MRALLAIVLAGCQAMAAPAGDRVLLTGSVQPSAATEITVPVTDESSLLLRWIAADGTPVKAGDRIAELDATAFVERLRTGRAELASAETQVRLAQRAAENQLADKRFAVRRAEIEQQKAQLRAQLPATLLTARVAKENQARLSQADAELRAAKLDLAQATKLLALEERTKRIDLDAKRAAIQLVTDTIPLLELRAPRDGVVGIAINPSESRAVRIDDTVEQGQVLATLPDLTRPMEVHADLSDVDSGRVEVGDTATCTIDAYPDAPIGCTVASIGPVARAPSRDSLRRAFDVRLTLAADHQVPLRPNLSVKVAFGGGVVERRSAVTSVEVSGELAAETSLDIKTPRFRDPSYFTIAWLAPDATDVAAGAPIVRFDDTELDRTIASAKADIAELAQRSERRRAETVLARRAEALRIFEAEAATKRAAFKQLSRDLVSAIDLRTNELDAELAQLELAQAKRAAAFAKESDAVDLKDFADARIATLQRLAELEDNRSRLTVAAPRAGTIVYETVGNNEKRKVGDGIYQGGVVGKLVGLDAMIGLGVVDEVDLGRLHTGARVRIRLDALPDLELRGTLQAITNDVVTRDSDPSKVVRVRLAVESGGALLRPGMRFRGTIVTARPSGGAAIQVTP